MRYDTYREGRWRKREIGGMRKRERDTQQNRERETRTAGVCVGGDEVRERFCGEMCSRSHMQGRTQFAHYFASGE